MANGNGRKGKKIVSRPRRTSKPAAQIRKEEYSPLRGGSKSSPEPKGRKEIVAHSYNDGMKYEMAKSGVYGAIKGAKGSKGGTKSGQSMDYNKIGFRNKSIDKLLSRFK
tara:strand:+ start:36 stop:362 length:327 start_codon:yes stop_codon:yes gene_type:complete